MADDASAHSDVLNATAQGQLKSIIEAVEPEDQRVVIGTSPLASDAKVSVDPNKIFGRHLAVLGNTGSGKSCSVAGLIRWSLEKAKEERQRQGQNDNVKIFYFLLPRETPVCEGH